jgi:hypothetical protein
MNPYFIKIATLLLTAAIQGVNPPTPEPTAASTSYIGVVGTASIPKFATYSETITKDNHYKVMFDDPNNEWRCDIVGHSEGRYETTAFTVACFKSHPVEMEGK